MEEGVQLTNKIVIKEHRSSSATHPRHVVRVKVKKTGCKRVYRELATTWSGSYDTAMKHAQVRTCHICPHVPTSLIITFPTHALGFR